MTAYPYRPQFGETLRLPAIQWARRMREEQLVRRMAAAENRAAHRLGADWHVIEWPNLRPLVPDGKAPPLPGFLAIGPGGIFSISLVQHGRGRVLIAGDVVQIGGKRPPYVVQARRDARQVGKALSAASIIAMAGDEVLMSPAAVMMIHNPWIRAVGDAAELRHMAGVLDEIKESIINPYQLKTGLPRDEISRLMDEETWMSARKAVELGFADGILYTEEASDQASARAAPAFAFSRLAVQNKADAAMRRLFDLAREQRAANNLKLQLELIKLREVREEDES